MENISGLDPQRFRGMVDGKATRLFVLTNRQGCEMAVCNYGATILSLMVPDREGQMGNVVLSMEGIAQLVDSPEPTLGTAIGRYGNRIAGARFTLMGKSYQVGMSQPPNCLHGGFKGFNKVVWDAEQPDAQSLVLRYTSPDGEEGFPGTLQVVMTYTLTDENDLRIDYSAITDRPTICNLTNHSYFNLDGVLAEKPVRPIDDYLLTMNADEYIPINEVCIPLGYKASVEGTPFDFRSARRIGDRIDDTNSQQIVNGSGYDHSFCIRPDAPRYTGHRPVAGLRLAAVVESPASGRVLHTYTTEPGLQLYTANWLSGFAGCHGATFPRRCAFCLEAQHHPDSINQAAFEQPVLLPGQVYAQTTIYAFSKK